MTDWTTLVDAEAVASRVSSSALRIFDCRSVLTDPQAGIAAWRLSHLPGALHANLEHDLSGPHTPGAGRHPWPDAAAFSAWLGRCGVTADTQVVAYDAGDGAYAARLWFLLHVLGHHKVAVLDGGFSRWIALGLPTDDLVPDVVPKHYDAGFDSNRLLDATVVAGRIAAGDLLVDARGGERFRGENEPIDPVAGHVPGAINRPYPANLSEGRFKSAEQLAEEFNALLDGRDPDEVITMCGSGVTACHHLLAMAHAGLKGAKLFTGSWSGWIEDTQRPVAIGSE